MFSSMKASWWQVLKLPSFPNRSFGGSRQVIPRKYVQPSTFVQEDLPLSFKMLAKVFNCFWTWMFFKQKCVFWKSGLWKSSSFNRFFPLAERQFSRDPPLILLKQRVTVCILEFLNTWWSNLAPEIKQQQEQQIHTRLFVDPSQKLNTHTHSTLHLDCVNRLQMISQKWNQGFGGVFPSWLLVRFQGTQIKSPMLFWWF